jgi:hypothetical protein
MNWTVELDKGKSEQISFKKYDEPQLARMNKYRNRWMTADENGWEEALDLSWWNTYDGQLVHNW